MYKVINQKTKGMWRGMLYAGLGLAALLSYENAFAAADCRNPSSWTWTDTGNPYYSKDIPLANEHAKLRALI